LSDRRYSTARWQRLRKAVLAHYGHVCQIAGTRCTGYATTVHHLIPSSQAPELFWSLRTSPPAARPATTPTVPASLPRTHWQTIESLRVLVWEQQQQQQIAKMAERLARYEHRKRPAIY
jgi:5-methylcytosine-specific restriction endonuclease McrA